jgi:hypothetical protein
MQTQADTLALAMVHALKRSDLNGVIQQSEAALASAQGRLALQARIHAWVAQAHLGLSQLRSARTSLRSALALARQAGDEAGLGALKELQTRIFSASVSPAQANPPDLPDTPVGHAVAAIDAGDMDTGERLARQARAQAQADGQAREEVLALLALARVPGETRAAILTAAEVADAAGDMNLVTAVAKAAKAASITLEAKVFGGTPWP